MEDTLKNVKGILLSELPESICGTSFEDPEEYVKTYLKNALPRSDKITLEKDMSWHFVLHKHTVEKKKKPTKRKTYMTRKERSKAGLLKLSKDGWNYDQLEELREMWRSYMRDNLDGAVKAPSITDPDYAAFSVVLGKSELVGAEITVSRSKVPSMVDRRGTVVLETSGTLQIVTPENKLLIVLKSQSVFCIELDNMRFTIFGKHLNTRPSERSTKKIKSLMHPDL